MNIYEQLEELSRVDKNVPQVKRYLLACCGKYIKYRSSGNLETGIGVAKRFIAGYASQKQLRDCEWVLEGEAFGVSFYIEPMVEGQFSIDTEMLNDLRKVRISERLTHKEAVEYLELLAYFIDDVICYCLWTSDEFIQSKFRQFLSPQLFKIYFG